MQMNLRREVRQLATGTYTLVRQAQGGRTTSVEVKGVDLSPSGIRVLCPHELVPGEDVYMEAQGSGFSGHSTVRHSTPHKDGFRIGLEFTAETKASFVLPDEAEMDYYEFLQISPRADMPTLHRIYRIMAIRFHPDNPETGDPEKFLALQTAYEVLSDPKRRAAYDASLQQRDSGPLPVFAMNDFVNGIEGEVNRRLGVLSLLYNKRRTSSHSPGISLLDLEKRMGIPREYLDFTTWYLKSKQFITIADNSEFALTATGVDYVESKSSEIPILDHLLQSGPRCATSGRGDFRGPQRRTNLAFLPAPGDPAVEPAKNDDSAPSQGQSGRSAQM